MLGGAAYLVAVFHTPSKYLVREHAYFALLYLVLAAVLAALVRWIGGLGRVAAWSVSFLAAFVLAAQMRLDAEWLVGTVRLAGAVLVLGLVMYKAFAPPAPGAARTSAARPFRSPGWRGAGRTVLLGGMLVALTLAGFRGSESLRWHLLLDHRLFGLPLYALLCRPIQVERDLLWDAHPPVEAWQVAGEVVDTRPVARPNAPNVVFVLVDTLRADALAAYGGDEHWMPNVNALAKRSLVFRDVVANASWTRASCGSMFTGLLPEEHGAVRFHDRLDERWETLPELLAAAGYQTAAFVANWVQVGEATGFAQGFDEFHELLGDTHLEGRAKYARAESVNEATLAWLAGEARSAAAAEGRPAFLYLHYLDPHSPYLSGPEEGLRGGLREQKRGLYRQELRYFDRCFADLLAGIDRHLGPNTAIVFTSDHGEEFWEHGQWGHGHSLYGEVVKIPLVVYLPARESGGAVVERLEGRDVYDLVANLVDMPQGGIVGWAQRRNRDVRYASQFLDRVGDVRPDKKHTAMRRVEHDQEALIWSGFGPTLELYDLARDGQELRNRIDRSPERAEALRRRLEDAVRFQVRAPRVESSDERLRFLRDLGYAGGERDEDVR